MNKNDFWLKKMIFAVLSLLLLNSGCSTSSVIESVESDPQQATQSIQVTIRVDYQGRRDDDAIHVRLPENSTAFDALEAAKGSSEFDFSFIGQKKTAFITSIRGVENEGASRSNWFYYVNEILSDRGCGATVLSDDDEVLWKFK